MSLDLLFAHVPHTLGSGDDETTDLDVTNTETILINSDGDVLINSDGDVLMDSDICWWGIVPGPCF